MENYQYTSAINSITSQKAFCTNLVNGLEQSASDGSRDRISNLLDKISSLTDVEKLLLYLKLPTGCANEENIRQTPTSFLCTSNRLEQSLAVTWIRSHLEEDHQICVPKHEVYDEYRSYCESQSLKVLCPADFGKMLKYIFPAVKPRRLGQRGQSRYCYSGLRKRLHIHPPSLTELEIHSKDVKTVDQQEAGLLDASCHLVCEWAGKLLSRAFSSLPELSEYLVGNLYVNSRSTAAFTVLASMQEAGVQKMPAPVSSLFPSFSGEDRHRETQLQLQRKLQERELLKEQKRRLQQQRAEIEHEEKHQREPVVRCSLSSLLPVPTKSSPSDSVLCRASITATITGANLFAASQAFPASGVAPGCESTLGNNPLRLTVQQSSAQQLQPSFQSLLGKTANCICSAWLQIADRLTASPTPGHGKTSSGMRSAVPSLCLLSTAPPGEQFSHFLPSCSSPAYVGSECCSSSSHRCQHLTSRPSSARGGEASLCSLTRLTDLSSRHGGSGCTEGNSAHFTLPPSSSLTPFTALPRSNAVVMSTGTALDYGVTDADSSLLTLLCPSGFQTGSYQANRSNVLPQSTGPAADANGFHPIVDIVTSAGSDGSMRRQSVNLSPRSAFIPIAPCGVAFESCEFHGHPTSSPGNDCHVESVLQTSQVTDGCGIRFCSGSTAVPGILACVGAEGCAGNDVSVPALTSDISPREGSEMMDRLQLRRQLESQFTPIQPNDQLVVIGSGQEKGKSQGQQLLSMLLGKRDGRWDANHGALQNGILSVVRQQRPVSDKISASSIIKLSQRLAVRLTRAENIPAGAVSAFLHSHLTPAAGRKSATTLVQMLEMKPTILSVSDEDVPERARPISTCQLEKRDDQSHVRHRTMPTCVDTNFSEISLITQCSLGNVPPLDANARSAEGSEAAECVFSAGDGQRCLHIHSIHKKSFCTQKRKTDPRLSDVPVLRKRLTPESVRSGFCAADGGYDASADAPSSSESLPLFNEQWRRNLVSEVTDNVMRCIDSMSPYHCSLLPNRLTVPVDRPKLRCKSSVGACGSVCDLWHGDCLKSGGGNSEGKSKVSRCRSSVDIQMIPGAETCSCQSLDMMNVESMEFDALVDDTEAVLPSADEGKLPAVAFYTLPTNPGDPLGMADHDFAVVQHDLLASKENLDSKLRQYSEEDKSCESYADGIKVGDGVAANCSSTVETADGRHSLLRWGSSPSSATEGDVNVCQFISENSGNRTIYGSNSSFTSSSLSVNRDNLSPISVNLRGRPVITELSDQVVEVDTKSTLWKDTVPFHDGDTALDHPMPLSEVAMMSSFHPCINSFSGVSYGEANGVMAFDEHSSLLNIAEPSVYCPQSTMPTQEQHPEYSCQLLPPEYSGLSIVDDISLNDDPYANLHSDGCSDSELEIGCSHQKDDFSSHPGQSLTLTDATSCNEHVFFGNMQPSESSYVSECWTSCPRETSFSTSPHYLATPNDGSLLDVSFKMPTKDAMPANGNHCEDISTATSQIVMAISHSKASTFVSHSELFGNSCRAPNTLLSLLQSPILSTTSVSLPVSFSMYRWKTACTRTGRTSVCKSSLPSARALDSGIYTTAISSSLTPSVFPLLLPKLDTKCASCSQNAIVFQGTGASSAPESLPKPQDEHAGLVDNVSTLITASSVISFPLYSELRQVSNSDLAIFRSLVVDQLARGERPNGDVTGGLQPPGSDYSVGIPDDVAIGELPVDVADFVTDYTVDHNTSIQPVGRCPCSAEMGFQAVIVARCSRLHTDQTWSPSVGCLVNHQGITP